VLLLQIAGWYAAHPTSGSELRNYNLGASLAQKMSVIHVGFSQDLDQIHRESRGARHELIAVPRQGSYRPTDLLRGLFGSVPFSILNYTRPQMAAELTRIMSGREIEVVLLGGISLAGYLPVLHAAGRRKPLIVCDWHNVESEILKRYSETNTSTIRRFYAAHTADKLQRYERRFLEMCDLHVTVSERDRATLGAYGSDRPVIVVENGVAVEAPPPFPSTSASLRRRVLFVGAMDYHANADAVSRFAAGVWPEIRRTLPHAVFTVVGRSPSAEIRALAKPGEIEVTGTVADVRPFYDEAFAAVVPLRVAGGTRIKILEAMAAGVPVVSTARGAEGLPAEPGTHYILADTGEEMKAAIVGLASGTARAASLTAAAYDLVRSRYSWSALGGQLAERILSLAASRRREE
jgi:glycosyltransferase involved in cell wall biosynthesis